jgi:hypothetical protein
MVRLSPIASILVMTKTSTESCMITVRMSDIFSPLRYIYKVTRLPGVDVTTGSIFKIEPVVTDLL